MRILVSVQNLSLLSLLDTPIVHLDIDHFDRIVQDSITLLSDKKRSIIMVVDHGMPLSDIRHSTRIQVVQGIYESELRHSIISQQETKISLSDSRLCV